MAVLPSSAALFRVNVIVGMVVRKELDFGGASAKKQQVMCCSADGTTVAVQSFEVHEPITGVCGVCGAYHITCLLPHFLPRKK